MEIQRKAFLFAQSINLKAKCAVIISLREGYYYSWRNKPPFDAFRSNVYHVTAPPYKEVLQKRIVYALEKYSLDGRSVGGVNDSFRIDIDNSSLKDFLLSVNKSLFIDKNSEMLSFLQETTYPNIREGLEIFKSFLLSGHTNVEQYILRHRTETESQNQIPIWEFIKAVALENKKYYNHVTSRIANLFYPAEGSYSHFLKLKILYYLKNQIDVLGYKEKFIPAEKIIGEFSKVKYRPKIIIEELTQLMNYSLIETEDTANDRDLTLRSFDNLSVSITLKGYYYLNSLLTSFAYIDLVLQDTPIFSTEYYEKIKRAFPITDDQGKRSISKRYLSVKEFIDYLVSQEKLETVESEIIPINIMQNLLTNGLKLELTRLSRIME